VSAVLAAQEPSVKYLVNLQPPLVRHFDLVAQAPGGVARLRELILTLAVQGKLVPQAPSDEPASELLKKIRLEKDRLIAEGKIKRDKPLAEITDEEKPFELPTGWSFCRLGDLLLSIRSGGTPSKQNPDFWNGEIPWASVKDLRFGEPLTDTQDRITQAGLAAGSELAPAGSILICTRMGLGKIGEALIDVAINQDLKAVVVGAGVDKQYFINYFKTLSVVGSGMTVAGIKQDELLGFVVPLPPSTEQSRIVTRVEELMQLCDALEASGQLEAQQHAQLVNTLLGTLTQSQTPEALADNWQRIATHFDLLIDRTEAVDALEQTILQLAVRGLLVPQDPTDEPASSLLQKIRTEKDHLIAQGKIKRDKPLPLITDEEKPFELPQGWEWVTIDTLANVGTGTTPSRDNAAFFDGGAISWVTSGETGQPFICQTEQHVTEAALAQTSLTIYPVGTLVVAMYGQGKTRGQISELCIPATTNQACAAIVLVEPSMAHKDYVKLVFEKSYDEIRELSAGGAQPNLNVGKVKATLIPLPPMSEQSRIVTRVNELRSLCADLRQRLTAGHAVQSHLADALVTG
jgi:type I restriction enzyme S subunit